MAKSSVGIELSNSTFGAMEISTPFAGFKGMSRDNSSNFKFDYGFGSTTTQSVAAGAQPLATNWFMFKDPNNSWLVSDARMSFYSVGSSITLSLLRARVITLMNAFNILTPTNTPTPTPTPTPYGIFSANTYYEFTDEMFGSYSGGTYDPSLGQLPRPANQAMIGDERGTVYDMSAIRIGGFDGLNN